MPENFEEYLKSTPVVDWETPLVLERARELASGYGDDVEKARAVFQWVRDEVKHSYDFSMNPLTCNATDVLKNRTGYCYAKSHLLVALLRANGIPSGFCYQRLRAGRQTGSFSLHSYCGAFLPGFGWYRMDPRGNGPGIDAQFMPPKEKLAYGTEHEGEWDDPRIRPEPLEQVVHALNAYAAWDELWENLPDLPLKPE